MAVPLIAGEQLLGVLDVQSEQVGRFTPTDIAIQTTLGAQLAVALQNAHQYQATLQSERIVRTIIDSAPDWISIKDRDHHYRLVNKAYADSLSLSADEIIGKNDIDLGFSEQVVRGDPEQGIRGLWSDDDLVISTRQMIMIPEERLMVKEMNASSA
jgi:GAF domain-containing protein